MAGTIIIPAAEMNSFDLPRVCLLTGEQNNIVFKEMKFQYVPPWARLFGALIQVLVARKAKGELPFSEAAHAAMKKGQLMFGLSFVGSFVLFGIFGAISGATRSGIPMLLGLAAAIALPIVVYQKMLKGKFVRCTMIEKDGRVTLNIPSDAAAQMISTHLSGPRMARPA